MQKTNIEKVTITALIFSAIIGYNISYEKLYLFHGVVACYYFLILAGIIKIRKQTVKKIIPLTLFGVYFSISLLWAPNFKNGATYLFYLLCAFSIILSLVNFAKDRTSIIYILKVIAIGLIINFLIGLIETTGHFRMPASPYAIPGSFKNIIASFNHPSGFYSNLNNFGFVFMISFPFFFFHPSKIIRSCGIIFLITFNITLQSKGFFLSTIVFFSLYFLINIKKKNNLIILISFLIIALIIFLSINTEQNLRIFTLFEQIDKGLSLIASGDISPTESTSIRAYFYLAGIRHLIESYGTGVGIAGISSMLAQNNDIISFHFFFLELLIDLGVIPFSILMYYYFKKIFNLLSTSKYESDATIKYIKKSIAFALLIAIPASIAPSSIIYILSFWFLIGLSLVFKASPTSYLSIDKIKDKSTIS